MFGKDYTYSNFKLIDGIPGWGQNILVIKAQLLSDRIYFSKSPFDGRCETISLMYDQITGTDIYSEDEIIEKSKSVVGRAAIGSLFGPLGGIIGGMSGMGKKQVTQTKYYYVISYISASGTEAMRPIGVYCAGCHWSQFDSNLKKNIPKRSPHQFL